MWFKREQYNYVVFFKQKTAYKMRISDWSSDVCSSDLWSGVRRRSVPVDATCDTDALPAMTGAVHKLVSSIAPHSDEGVNLSRRELLDAKDDQIGRASCRERVCKYA